MGELPNYPENRLDIRVDENGNVTFEQNAEFVKYYAPTREELEEELEDLQYQLEMLELDEPVDRFDGSYTEWEEEVVKLKNRIEELEEALSGRR
ncbi:MAG: DUF4482 domain-containing protein [Clostridiales bacterium]|nr:DUF4482 domain-containing protein [Clostridiales bacterium]